MDEDDENKWNMDLQDLIGKNTTPDYKSASENRMTFPGSKTYLDCEYENVPANAEEGIKAMEIWTCYCVLEGDESQSHIPICSFIKELA